MCTIPLMRRVQDIDTPPPPSCYCLSCSCDLLSSLKTSPDTSVFSENEKHFLVYLEHVESTRSSPVSSGTKKNKKTYKLLCTRTNKPWAYHIFKTRMHQPSLNVVSASLRKELIWHLTHLLVFLHQSLIFELLVRSLQAP